MLRWSETLCRQLADSGLYVIRYDNRDTGAAAVEGWVTEDRMLYGTYPFDEAGSRETAEQQVRRASNILSHRFNHPIAVDRTPSWRHRLPDLNVPALIIHGTEDAVLPPAHAEALADEIPGARLVMIEQLGHVTAPVFFETIVPEVLSHTKK